MPTVRILPASILSHNYSQNILCSSIVYSRRSQIKLKHTFVPKYEGASSDEIQSLSEFVNTSKKLLAITGKFKVQCEISIKLKHI